MNNNPLTIIIPFYNPSKYFEDCLKSLDIQSFKDFSIILIDDGSTDGSTNIAKKYCKKNNNALYLSQNNGGAGKARNLGLSRVNSKYVMFLDSDDFLGPRAVELLLNKIKDEDALFFNPVIYDMNSREFVQWYDSKQITKLFKNNEYLSAKDCPELIGSEISLNRCVWNTKFLKDNNFRYPEIKWEDIPLHFYITHKIKKCSFIKGEYYYFYRINSGNQSTSKMSTSVNDLIKSLNLTLDIVEKEKFTKKETIQVLRFINLYAKWAISDVPLDQRENTINEFYKIYKRIKYKHLIKLRKNCYPITKKEFVIGFIIKNRILNSLYKNYRFFIFVKKVIRKIKR